MVKSGPYGFVRHPQLLSAMLMCVFGSFFKGISDTAGALHQALLFGVGLWGLTLLEERDLQRSFGEAYSQYRQAVPRFFPRLGDPQFRRLGSLLLLPSCAIVLGFDLLDLPLHEAKSNPGRLSRPPFPLMDAAEILPSLHLPDEPSMRDIRELSPWGPPRFEIPVVICAGPHVFYDMDGPLSENLDERDAMASYARAAHRKLAGVGVIALYVANLDSDEALEVVAISKSEILRFCYDLREVSLTPPEALEIIDRYEHKYYVDYRRRPAASHDEVGTFAEGEPGAGPVSDPAEEPTERDQSSKF